MTLYRFTRFTRLPHQSSFKATQYHPSFHHQEDSLGLGPRPATKRLFTCGNLGVNWDGPGRSSGEAAENGEKLSESLRHSKTTRKLNQSTGMVILLLATHLIRFSDSQHGSFECTTCLTMPDLLRKKPLAARNPSSLRKPCPSLS